VSDFSYFVVVLVVVKNVNSDICRLDIELGQCR